MTRSPCPDGRTRVLLVGKGAPDVGGIPSFLAMISSSTLNDAFDITFLNVSHAGTPEAGQVTWGNVKRTAADATAVWRQAGSNDIVHIHSALTPTVTIVRAGLMAAAGRLRGSRVIVHAHGGNLQSWLNSRRARVTMRMCMVPAHRVVAVWSAGADALSEILGKHKVSLIDNGIDAESFQVTDDRSTASDRAPTILYVGLLTPRKGVIDLLDASRILRERGISHRLCLVGGVPDEGPEAQQQVLSQVQGHAELLGRFSSSEMPKVYGQADIFCLPSWWEAMPLSLLEAMACELPAVATDVGDVSRAIAEGVTGHVVPIQNPESLAAALEDLLGDAERSRSMGRAGRRRVVENFSQFGMLRAIGELYSTLAAPMPISQRS